MKSVKSPASWVESLLPLVFAILRAIKPVLRFGSTTLVTRFNDVQEVLSHPDVFGVPYAEKMGVITDGSNFFLGMDNSEEYTRDVSNMRLIIRRQDVDEIVRPMVQQLCDDIMSQSNGQMDVVKELTGPVPARLSRDYLGIPGPTEAELIEWTTWMFQYLFFPGNPTEVDEKATTYAAQTRDYLDALIQQHKSNPNDQDSAINRCLALQQSGTPGMSDIDIRNNMIGIIIGAIPTTSKASAQVIDYLLNKPALLADARMAAKNDDLGTMRQYVLEILRFTPFGAGIFRLAKDDYTLTHGMPGSRKIRKSTKVLVATQSAMFDKRELYKPRQFRLDRPEYHYMPFGYGMHTCFGYHINMVQIPLIVAAVLKQPGLRRAPDTQMEQRGPFPSSLKIEFDKHPS